jgi:Tfp pilus assembly protein PilW
VRRFRSSSLLLSRDQGGFTVVELVVALSLMLIVIGSLMTAFTSGANAEHDLRLRFEAQNEARLALDKFRRELHNACGATVVGGTSVTLRTIDAADLRNFPCSVASATWCTIGSGSRFALYRQAGASCGSGGRRIADYLTSGAIFALPPVAGGQLPRLEINMTVNRKPSVTRLQYRLNDAIALRNARRI